MLWEQVQRVGHQLLLRLEREEQTDNQGRNKDQPQSQFTVKPAASAARFFVLAVLTGNARTFFRARTAGL